MIRPCLHCGSRKTVVNTTARGPVQLHYYAFNIKNGDHFELNRTAYWVLEAIGDGMTLTELKPSFAEMFELNAEIAENDLTEVISFGIENHIIKEVEA